MSLPIKWRISLGMRIRPVSLRSRWSDPSVCRWLVPDVNPTGELGQHAFEDRRSVSRANPMIPVGQLKTLA
jgi:hypothetical protein